MRGDEMTNESPIQGPEWRSQVFVELDRMIAAGWGSVPQDEIAKVRRRHGGVLPHRDEPLDELPDDDEVADIIEALRLRQISFQSAVFEAVVAGYDTCGDIATRFGWPRIAVGPSLVRLVRAGELVIESRGRKRVTVYGVARRDISLIKPPEAKPERKQDCTRIVAAVKAKQIATIDGVFLAVCAGYSLSVEIADLFGLSRNTIGFHLKQLADSGKIRIARKAKTAMGAPMSVYVPVEEAKAA